MKRVCKNVDIENRDLIVTAVLDCLHRAKKRQRADTRRLFARLLGVSPSRARRALAEQDELYFDGVQRAADMLLEKIRSRRLDLPPVYQQLRRDPGSKKIRKIAILSIEQLMLDHVAVLAMRELTRRVGEYQVSSIKGRGAAYGKRAVERWVAKKSCRYGVKLDIKDFYGSVKRPLLLRWLHEHVKNRPLLWLIGQLIYTVPQGIAIGSYLSQTLANIYLSDLYHLAMERCRSKRGKRQVAHALFYMDDMLLLGSNRRQLRFAVLTLIERAGELGLQIKRGWHVFQIEHKRPVDMMGYRFSQSRTTLRKRVFKSARRVIIRAKRRLRRGRGLSLPYAARLASFNGYTSSAACNRFLDQIGARKLYKAAFNHISKYNQNRWTKHDTPASRSRY